MAANRFAVLTEEDSIDSIDSPQRASPADKFDTTTLSAALKGARQAASTLDCYILLCHQKKVVVL